jgi:large subunit ribosomal protein L29
MKRAVEIRQMTNPELGQAIQDAKEEMFNLRFQWASGQLEDATRMKQLRKDIARLLTIQRERELAAALIREEGLDAE